MDPDTEIEYDFSPYLYLYKSGRVKRLGPADVVPPPPSPDAASGVASKDVVLDPATGVSARLFLPNLAITRETEKNKKKLPVLIYFHGGGFAIGSPFSSTYHDFVRVLVARARVVAVSVDYRLAPEQRLPTAYHDSLAALRWVAAHARGVPEAWLAEHGDFRRIFLVGDSAGANIAHNILLDLGETGNGLASGAGIEGLVLIHPYFWGKQPVGSETADPRLREEIESAWGFISGWTIGVEDPRVDPMMEETARLKGMPCRRVLVVVAEKDFYAERGRAYYEILRGSGWKGKVGLFETPGEQHVFYLRMPLSSKAVAMRKRIAAFLNGDRFLHNLFAAVRRKFNAKNNENEYSGDLFSN